MPDDRSLITELPFGLPGRVFRSPMPYGDFDPGQLIFALYRQAGVQAVVALPEAGEMLEKTGRDLLGCYAAQGLAVHHIPIRDFSAPPPEVVARAVEAIWQEAQRGRTVAVHCHAGVGRTGLVLACLARRALGLSAEEAVAWVRQYIPKAVETEEQRQAVSEFGAG